MKIVVVALGLLLAPISAYAFTCTATGCTFAADYTEPSTVITGLPLTNLTSTTVSYRIAVDGGAPGAIKTVTVPASKATGGGHIVQNITDAALVPGHDYVISGFVTATNPAGTSTSSNVASLTIPRAGEVPPANPSVDGSFK